MTQEKLDKANALRIEIYNQTRVLEALQSGVTSVFITAKGEGIAYQNTPPEQKLKGGPGWGPAPPDWIPAIDTMIEELIKDAQKRLKELEKQFKAL